MVKLSGINQLYFLSHWVTFFQTDTGTPLYKTVLMQVRHYGGSFRSLWKIFGVVASVWKDLKSSIFKAWIMRLNYMLPLHKKWSFPLRFSSVNVTKSPGNCGFGHIIHALSKEIFNEKLHFCAVCISHCLQQNNIDNTHRRIHNPV